MNLKPVDVIENISPDDFKLNYYQPQIPVVIKNFSKRWTAYNKWTWNDLKQVAGNEEVGIYKNAKSDAYTPINKADDYTTFGNYINMVQKGPAAWRIFLFNIFLIMRHSL